MAAVDEVTRGLRTLGTDVVSGEERDALGRMLREDVRARRQAANRGDAEAWARVRSRVEWEAFRDERLAALRESLGPARPEGEALDARVTRVIRGEGFRIDNVVYESRPGVWVTANLYLPSAAAERMPAILLVHSHHNPKTQGELQDMGMTWARCGCAVLVMDQLGYGERRTHAEGPRQDYRFRAITGMQLHILGESLMGWMMWDIRRGIDFLLSREGVDRERVVLMGAVAGGGDPAAVAAALDPRVTCAIPFNFGGPQPETTYPLPADAEETFDTMGRGSWESTRNLRLSGRDGFMPWVIVASVAPRCLIYAHEFSWDQERDPIWKRLQRVWAFYGVPERLAFAHGAGVLSGQPPEATHCNNVGPVHRRMIYPHLQRWFGIPIPEVETQWRLPPEELACLGTGRTLPGRASAEDTSPPREVHELLGEIGASRAAAAREALAPLPPGARRERLRRDWARLLGDVEPSGEPTVGLRGSEERDGVRIERVVLEVEPGIVVPLLVLRPGQAEGGCPVVVGVAQEGKETFLRERAVEIARLLASGIAVCLADVRGTGETRPVSSRERQSEATSLSATELMLGQTLLGARLRDVRSLLRYVRGRSDVDSSRIALWGESFAPVNPAGFVDPLLGEGEQPAQSEPLGGLLALFGALYEEEVCAVVARGTPAGYEALLWDRFCYVPHDAVVPGALTVGDLGDVAAALAPRPLRVEGLVDGRNCRLEMAEVERGFEAAIRAYREAGGELLLASTPGEDLGPWLVWALESVL